MLETIQSLYHNILKNYLMKNKGNLFLDSKGIYNNTKRVNQCRVSKMYTVIPIAASIVDQLCQYTMESIIKGVGDRNRTHLFDIFRRGVNDSYDKVLGRCMSKIDEYAAVCRYLPFIHDYESWSPRYLTCLYTNSIILDSGDNVDDDPSSIVNTANEMLNIYHGIRPLSIKALIINNTDSVLNHVVHDDGSFDARKCLYSDERRVNFIIEGDPRDGYNKNYTINLPHYVRRVLISATVVNYTPTTQFGISDRRNCRDIRLFFPDIISCKEDVVVSDEAHGNLHRIILDIDFTERSGLDFKLKFNFQEYIKKYFIGDEPLDYIYCSTISIAMDDFPDFKCKTFFDDVVALNQY